MLTARADESMQLACFDAGADDCLSKPLSLRELHARIRAHLRRHQQGSPEREDGGPLLVAQLEIDRRSRTVTRDSRPLALKPKEFDLLYWFASNPGQVFTRHQLLERVWGYDPGNDTRTIDVHVRWLREKIEDDPHRPRHLQTLRGVGYRFVR